MKDFSLFIVLIIAGLTAGIVFLMAHLKRSDTNYSYWHIRFIADGIEDDITFRIHPQEDPASHADYAIERYCSNMKKRVSKLLTMEVIDREEYVQIRTRLFSKLNQPLP